MLQGFSMDDDVIKHLKSREGVKYESYNDSLGKLTGGVGHLLTSEEQALYPLGTVIPENVVNMWLEKDLAKAKKAAQAQITSIPNADVNLENALISVNFQLGDNWYKDHKQTWKYLKSGDFENASKEVYNSDWAKQTPVRVKDFSKSILKTQDNYNMKIYNDAQYMKDNQFEKIHQDIMESL